MTDRPHADFIRANTRPLPVPSLPSIALYQADQVTPLWLMTEKDMDRAKEKIILAPPFWAFAWSGGQALAAYILDHRETVAGKRVLDLACGSGLVGIAAARAGAARVLANDIDPYAEAAVALNAGLNGVRIDFLPGDLVASGMGGPVPDVDILLAGDICYEKTMTGAMLTFLGRARAKNVTVLVGDPHRTYFPRTGFRKLADYSVRTIADIEDVAEKPAAVWEFTG